jgi:pSer/pThr/pTyr-binding forkhead associated (FHA) protein
MSDQIETPPETATGWLVLDEPGGPRVELPDSPGTTLTIGRDPACEAQVPFDDTQVSRRHTQLSWAAPGAWTVTDLCSSNGTLVGGHRVTTPTPVGPGQFIQVGQTVYRIDAAPDDPR